VTEAPTISNGQVYFCGFQNANTIPGIEGSLYSVNATSGTQNWRFIIELGHAPTVVNGSVYVGSFPGGIYSIDETTGLQNWRYDGGITRANPAVVNGIVYSGAEIGAAFALDETTGLELWRHSNSHGGSSSATIANNTMYIGNGAMNAFDIATGVLKWQVASFGTTTGSGSGFFSSPVVYNGTVYCGNNDTWFYAFDANTGAVKWRHGDATRTGFGAPQATVANGIVYAGSWNNYIYAYNAETGAVLWRYLTGGSVYSGPCVMDSRNNYHHSGASGMQQ
jgi:outer membrane protein assembly factor BamB